MKVDTVEVYENNNGTIEIYALVSCTEVWSCAYQASADLLDQAARDFAALFFAGVDPVSDGWDNDNLPYDATRDDLIASTAWYKGSTESMFESEELGYGGETFKASVIDYLAGMYTEVHEVSRPDQMTRYSNLSRGNGLRF